MFTVESKIVMQLLTPGYIHFFVRMGKWTPSIPWRDLYPVSPSYLPQAIGVIDLLFTGEWTNG